MPLGASTPPSQLWSESTSPIPVTDDDSKTRTDVAAKGIPYSRPFGAKTPPRHCPDAKPPTRGTVDAVMVRRAVVEIILARRAEAQQDGRVELRVCRAHVTHTPHTLHDPETTSKPLWHAMSTEGT